MSYRDYDIENLIETFKKHADQFDYIQKPESQTDSFNISRALQMICTTIQELKEGKCE
jgi:hypothetical protein